MIKLTINGTTITIPEGFNVKVNGSSVKLTPVKKTEPDTETAKLDKSINLLSVYNNNDYPSDYAFNVDVDYRTTDGRVKKYRNWTMETASFKEANGHYIVKIHSGDKDNLKWRTLILANIDSAKTTESVFHDLFNNKF